uniref:Uncharacterized protein n=1 Tax=Glossina brevipalpis TaxID=37001 RepID=A0A1A9WB59_9MUSC
MVPKEKKNAFSMYQTKSAIDYKIVEVHILAVGMELEPIALFTLVINANALQSSATVREFLEKNYTDEVPASVTGVITLAINALLVVVQSDFPSLRVRPACTQTLVERF